jgi:hypothetical protein
MGEVFFWGCCIFVAVWWTLAIAIAGHRSKREK